MERHLNLVESDFEQLEKIILPRFPFCFLTFKCSKENTHVFEVKDISNSGMQLGLKMGEHQLREEENIHGHLHWGANELEINGNVKWQTKMRIGVEFSTKPSSRDDMNSFLDLQQVAKLMRPVHKMDYGVEFPNNLKYWLRADGPVEVFVWQHNDRELSHIQILMMENFVEWEDGKGLKTARVISKRNIDTPLITEDEFVFKVDESIDLEKINLAMRLIDGLDENLMTSDVINFIKMKLAR